MTDHGSGYVSKAFRAACIELGVRHVRTRPYTPKSNGKSERFGFVQTSLREWAYAKPTSDHQLNAQQRRSPSCIATTDIGHTQHSTASHP
jgi:transposase InsO family protein